MVEQAVKEKCVGAMYVREVRCENRILDVIVVQELLLSIGSLQVVYDSVAVSFSFPDDEDFRKISERAYGRYEIEPLGLVWLDPVFVSQEDVMRHQRPVVNRSVGSHFYKLAQIRYPEQLKAIADLRALASRCAAM